MDIATARSVLVRVLKHIPSEFWWILRQTQRDETGLARACNVPLTYIDALLANAAIYRNTGHGFCFQKKAWENFCETLDNPLVHGTIRKDAYVANGRPPKYRAPA